MTDATLYPNVYCSQCGSSFGPGDHGFSHCYQHRSYAQDIERIADRLKDEADAIASLADEISPLWTAPDELEIAICSHAKAIQGILATIQEIRGRKQ